MSSFRQLMMKKKIPSIYKVLDWIQSSGTQYIDTGYVANGSTTTFDFKFETVNAYGAVFGSRKAYANSAFCLTNDSGHTRWDYSNNVASSFVAIGNIYNVKTKIVENNYIIEAYNNNGSLVNTASNAKSNFSANCNIYLFARNDNGVLGTDSRNITTFYYFKLYDNGTLVRNMIPVRRLTDNEVGMYDTVSKTFFGNAGTGAFVGSDE